MLRRFAHLLVLFAALQVAGGHWLALQSVAWVGMLVTYSQAEPLTVAVEKTFDGDHPCGLCKVVKKGQSEEQKQGSARVLLKFDAVLAPMLRVAARDGSQTEYPLKDERGASRAQAPPTPPPLRG